MVKNNLLQGRNYRSRTPGDNNKTVFSLDNRKAASVERLFQFLKGRDVITVLTGRPVTKKTDTWPVK